MGAVVVDKPAGWTSHDVVAKMRRIARTKKIGHLGTLDPAATGVLPLLIGRATRLAQFYGENEKTYRGTVKFGFSTNTYDAEGTPTSDPVIPEITQAQLEHELQAFRGSIEQIPPAVSAKKIQGRPAYELARKNIPVELKPVSVTIHELVLESFDGTECQLRIRCSAGTYIRSIAHDLGQRLGCGAHLSSLQRLQSGEFTQEQAHQLEDLQKAADAGTLPDLMISGEQLLTHLAAEVVDDEMARAIRQGRNFRTSPFRPSISSGYVRAFDEGGNLLAIAEPVVPHMYHPVCVL